MGDDRSKPVLHLGDLETMQFGHGETFSARLAQVGQGLGLTGIGCLLTVVEPGKRAFPFHVHHANDEMFVILEGEGEYRFGDATIPIKAGDVLGAPAGGPENAHQIINTRSAELKYLGISTKSQPEVVEYPDSGKFAVMSRMADGSPMTARLRYIGRPDATLDYWDGEGD